MQSTLSAWQDRVDALLREHVAGLFKGVEDLDILCTLRAEIISALADEETGKFEMGICGILVKEITKQITMMMTHLVRKIHQLEDMATEIIDNFRGTPR